MKRLFNIFIIAFSCSSVYAQQQTSGDLSVLINQSFHYFPQFKELGQAIDVEQQRIALAKAAGLPSFQATGTYNYINPVSEISIPAGAQSLSFQIMPKNNYKTTVNGSYTLWDFGVVKAGVDRARAGLMLAKDNLDYHKNQMAAQVSNIYYQIAYLKAAIEIQKSVIDFLERNKKDTEIKYKNGDALKYDVLSIQSSIDQENNRKIDLQTSLDKQYVLMEYTTGMKMDKIPLGFTFPVQGLEDGAEQSLEHAWNYNPEFKLLKDRIAQAQAELALSKTGGKPSLTLNAGTGYTNGYAPDIDRFRYNYTAGVTLNIPIYQGGRAKKQERLSESQLKQTRFAQETLNNTFKSSIKQVLTDINSNRSSLVNAGGQVAEAKEAQKLAQSRYRNGIGTNLELTSASTNVQKAELTRLQYEYQLCLAQVEMARLTGIKYW
nr:TolC family protein [Pedobacter sp. ASV19]